MTDRKWYYGWVIVGVALVSMSFWLGIRNSFSVYFVELLDEFGWQRGDMAGAQSVSLITYTVLAPLVGWFIDRYGPRRIVVPGVLVLILGLWLCSMVETLGDLFFYYGLVVGAGITCIGIITYSAVLAHWFILKRGLANGIALSGMGLGTFLLVPTTQYLIDGWGWGTAFLVTGGLVAILVLPANGIFLRHKPEDVGQLVDGGSERSVSSVNSATCDLHPQGEVLPCDMRSILTSTGFWCLVIFPFLSILGIYIVLVHNVKFMVDQGVSKATAAWAFAIVGIVSSVFRIFWGWLSDRWGRELTYSLGMTFACLGIGSLILVETTGIHHFVFAYSVMFGMGWGASAPMFMSVAADLFRGRRFGLIYGLVESGIGVSGALGAWVAGFIFDRTASYQMALWLALLAMASSCIFIWLAAPRKQHL